MSSQELIDTVYRGLQEWASCGKVESISLQEDIVSLTRALEVGARQECAGYAPLWKSLQSALLHFATEGGAQTEEWPLLYDVLRFLRNVVAGSPENQRRVVEAGIADGLISLGRKLHASNAPEARLGARLGGQALANTLMGYREGQRRLSGALLGTPEERGMLAILSRAEDAGTLTTALILLTDMVGGEGGVDTLLGSEDGTRIIRTLLSRAEAHFDDASNRNFILTYALIKSLTEDGIPQSLFHLLQVDELTPEAVSLLKFLDGRLAGEKELTLGKEDVMGMAKAFSPLARVLGRQMRGIEGEGVGGMEVGLAYTGGILLLQCLGSLTQYHDRGVSEALRTTTLLPDLIELLGVAEECVPRLNKAPSASVDGERDPLAGFAYLKRDIIRVVGHLCFEDWENQEALRACGGIPLLLAQCNIDDANPYIREYAILAVRHALQGNAGNQALVGEMEPVEAAQHPALDELGVRARLEDGRVKLEKK